MATAQVTSPRLPSPPPLTEDFIHPKSPVSLSEDHGKLEDASKVDHGASRRIRPGTRAVDMAEGPPVVDLENIDSSFAFTEHLKALYNAAIHPDPQTVQAIDRSTAGRLATPPDGVDKAAWLYELCRFLCQRVNTILVALFADDPPCSSHTCPEMRASEWQYLCAVHDPPKSCCAIDYCCHTLDWAATTLTSVKNFPSYGTGRQLDGSSANQLRQLTNVFRRVYRIFAHAWFQHREVFWHVEHRTGLYVFFKTVCDVYSLIPDDNYTIPPEAEGIEVEEKAQEQAEQPVILRRDTANKDEGEQDERLDGLLGAELASGNTTKRHRQSPSRGSTSVETVIEEIDEDESGNEPGKAGQKEAHDAASSEVSESQPIDAALTTSAEQASIPKEADETPDQSSQSSIPPVEKQEETQAKTSTDTSEGVASPSDAAPPAEHVDAEAAAVDEKQEDKPAVKAELVEDAASTIKSEE